MRDRLGVFIILPMSLGMRYIKSNPEYAVESGKQDYRVESSQMKLQVCLGFSERCPP